MMIRPYRTTIAGLMAFVFFVGLALATLRHEDQYRGTRIPNLALFALWVATVCATLGEKNARAEIGQSIRMVLSGFFGVALSRYVAGKDGPGRPNAGEDDRQATEGMG